MGPRVVWHLQPRCDYSMAATQPQEHRLWMGLLQAASANPIAHRGAASLQILVSRSIRGGSWFDPRTEKRGM